MLDVIHSRGLPLDRITTTDVWATDTISANLPPMDAFKERMDQKIWDLYRIEVEHLCARNPDGSKRTYEQMFYHVPVRKNSQSVQVERENRFRDDSPRGFPVVGFPWCQPILKKPVTPHGGNRETSQDSHQAQSDTTGVRSSNYPTWGRIKGWPLSNGKLTWCQKLKNEWVPRTDIPLVPEAQDRQGQNPFLDGPTTRGKRNIVEYLGIAADEPKRHGQMNARKRAPLVEFGIDEDLCGLYCQYNDMLSPSYETSCRDGCWFCHNQGVKQLRNLRKNYPDLWALLMKWDLDSPVSFKADGHTVHDFDRRFQLEDEGVIPDKGFRWDWLERPPGVQLSLF